MISSLARGISHHKKQFSSLAFRAAATNPLLPSSTTTQQSLPTYTAIPTSTLSPRFYPARKSVRMVSNSKNAPFTAEQLYSMKGRVALITGGGSGIGLMATQALVANGAKVYITGRTKEKLDTVAKQYSEGSGSIIPIQCDVTDKAQIADLVGQISSQEECLCVLINNAGISGETFQTEAQSAEEMKANLFDSERATFEDWASVYRTNVPQLYFMTTAFLPLLQRSSERHPGWSGTVLNISSISGVVKTAQHHFAYNASKAAAVHLTRMLATEIAANNRLKIRVNSIAPGVFPSEMTTGGESSGDQKSELDRGKYEQKVPARRPGKDEDMAQAVLFAVANQYLNGQTVVVDGGYTIAVGE